MFLQRFDPDSCTYTYLLSDDVSGEAVLIDPVLTQVERDLALLQQHGLQLVTVLDTHVHADHITAAAALKAATGAPSAVGADCNAAGYDRALNDGDDILFGAQRLHAIATPGHTPGSMSFLWEADEHPPRVFTGDTLLIGGCGRTDFQGGSSEQLWDSVTRRLFDLPGETRVLPGHDYHGLTESSIAAEKRDNPRFVGHTRDSFVAQMAALKLPPPRHIAEAVPANKRAGAPPDVAEEIQQA
ncbi:MBL fold metallo-hydrolase [uncultured Methylibium sp.]|uniref:MBL fold metallo-hydrolase n=1 Tax=uncultured Methylibium sp. TaxID=381093 RepID=UPI0025F31FBE|nr:MBL fold metallo-hydrolase [uncultured Methylibium sp.]